MAAGIIIHISVGAEKRTEFFSDERISVGSDESNEIQIHAKDLDAAGTWFELELTDDVYRLINLHKSLPLVANDKQPVRRFMAISDGDAIAVAGTDIHFSFFTLASKSALITTNRETPVAQFISEAAIESATSPKRDDAKAFLREFVRELSREVSWTSKLVMLVLAVGFVSGILYLGYSFNREAKQTRKMTEEQNAQITKLQQQLEQTSSQIGNIKESSDKAFEIISMAPRLRADYGNGVCLIVGVYDLVSKENGKPLRYPDPQALQPDPYEPMPMEDQVPQAQSPQIGLTTEGNGTPIEYDFIGTGFHVGNGFIVTNRHVLQPWTEDDLVKQLMRDSNGRPRVKRLVIYFPNFPQPFPLKVRQYGGREDLAVASIDPMLVSPDIPVLPLDADAEAEKVGNPVVSMGFPSGPDRLLAMFEDEEARTINSRCAGSRQCIITFLSQNRKIVPLTTQGSITDLDARRLVHDAKTAEGGSGSPLFGKTGKVIGVNFGVFTENTAANMAVPIRFALELLRRSGWKSPAEMQQQQQQEAAQAAANTAAVNANVNAKPPAAR